MRLMIEEKPADLNSSEMQRDEVRDCFHVLSNYKFPFTRCYIEFRFRSSDTWLWS